jgi:hypothetical protein
MVPRLDTLHVFPWIRPSQRKASTNSGIPLFRKFSSAGHLLQGKYAIHLLANGLRAERLYNGTVHASLRNPKHTHAAATTT